MDTWPGKGLPTAINFTANKDENGWLRRYVTVEQGSGSTCKRVLVAVAYPKLDMGEDTTVGHVQAEIEFADPGSIHDFIELISRKFD